MKLQKRTVRFTLIATVTAAMCLPLVSQYRNSKAIAQPAPAPSPTGGEGPKTPPAPAFPPTDPNKVILSVGDEKVTAGEFTTFFSELDPALQARVIAHPESKRQLAEQYVDMKLMAAEARRRKLNETNRVKTTYEQLLANALMVNISEQKEANQKYFEENKDWFSELTARHILIAVAGSGIDGAKLDDEHARAKAQDIKNRLDKGADFASMARTESDDKGSAVTGGNLGAMSRGQMVPPFEAAAYALADNEISQPVKTQFGYHIIQVQSRTVPTYEAAAQRVPRRRLEAIVDQLKKQQKPEMDDTFFSTGNAAKTGANATVAK